tara:strand:+ start:710 stop:994 length:285 start_codon:yes stop_codon:yes gene_type:complete
METTDDLTQVTLDELLEKAYKYDRHRISHNEKMKRYRLKYPEEYKARAAKLATKRYWRNKGFEITETGEKIKIQEIIENPEPLEIMQNHEIPVL